ncbi:transcriptional regulator [Mycobacterium tuberculosis]|nr:transcriptional regulator [Mycobacterium tuberculosis]CFE80195.1 transcriptional regulator [Mycobacterium tuberculosis]CFS00143.1 transcriptional regulator [Mycobacterium tuberculosis]CKR62340.1 transcriptional regulator [Mycobacterium tuberculosis]
MAAYTLAALVGQLAHRRLNTDDNVTAAQVADFVVSLVLDGLRPRALAVGARGGRAART